MSKTSTEQVMKALSGLIPEEAQTQVSEAVSKFLEGAVEDLEKEYNAELEKAYKQITEEKATDEKTAEEGYAQAWEIITELRNRLEIQKEEFETALEEGYEEAYQMLQEERSKNDTLEGQLYEEYDKKLQEVKEYMVNKLDQFLTLQGEKYYEMAKKEVSNDPTFAEHKLAFEKVLEVAQNYLSDEDYAYATSSRIDGLQKQLDENKSAYKILEAKNMRLATDNTRLNESIRQHKSVLTETAESERKARTEKAKKAEGRGQGHLDRQVVIGEQQDSGETEHKSVDDRSQRFVEQIGEDVFADWKHLSGLVKDEESFDEGKGRATK